jgi:hypothetical protein
VIARARQVGAGVAGGFATAVVTAALAVPALAGLGAPGAQLASAKLAASSPATTTTTTPSSTPSSTPATTVPGAHTGEAWGSPVFGVILGGAALTGVVLLQPIVRRKARTAG